MGGRGEGEMGGRGDGEIGRRGDATPHLRVPLSPRLRVTVSPRLRVPLSPRLRVTVSPRLPVSASPDQTSRDDHRAGTLVCEDLGQQRIALRAADDVCAVNTAFQQHDDALQFWNHAA